MKVNTGYFGIYSYITLTKDAGNGKIHKTSNSDDTGSVNIPKCTSAQDSHFVEKLEVICRQCGIFEIILNLGFFLNFESLRLSGICNL